MKKKLMLFIAVMSMSLNFSFAQKQNSTNICGYWRYNASNVPLEYNDGALYVTQSKDGKLIGSLFLESNTINNIEVFENENKKISITLFIDEPVVVELTPKEDKIVASIPSGYIDDIILRPNLLTKFLGNWKFEVANVPEQYKKGNIKIFPTGIDKFSAKIDIEGSQTKPEVPVKVESQSLVLKVDIEGETISININDKNNKIVATASSVSIGTVDVNLKRY